ncbi:MAG: LuxR C-terminal-related transcriptional regulator, partial [Anaerolineales bacterium]
QHDYLLNQQPTIEQEFVYRLLIEILILQGDFKRAKNILKSFLPVVERSDSIDRLIRISIIQCKVLCGLGETDKAMTMLSDALELAQPRGYFRLFVDGGEQIAQLLYQCVQRGIHKQYCSKLLEAFPTDTKAINIRESDSDINLFIEPLSNRELEVLSLIAEGCTNQEIAQELYLSLYTVKSHARNIYSKLGVKNRTEAVAKARLFGLLPQDQVST